MATDREKTTAPKRFDFSVIRNLRKKWGITAEELAQRAELTRATVAKIESGDGNPTIDTIESLSRVFQLSSSELVRLAEVTQCETAQTKRFRRGKIAGTFAQFPNVEIFHIKAGAGARKESDPKYHTNTAEVCMVLSGKINAVVAGNPHKLGPGNAIRFKAMQDHYFDIIEDAEFLLMHHSLV
jgi:transcriptional regulator with XRE-family HTH domain